MNNVNFVWALTSGISPQGLFDVVSKKSRNFNLCDDQDGLGAAIHQVSIGFATLYTKMIS